MTKYRIYPKELEKIVQETKLIPRKIYYEEKLKLYHKYFIPIYGSEVIKVENISTIYETEYYFIRYGNKMNGCLSYPIYRNSYELLHNDNNIGDSEIINSNIAYSGAEIKFWFFINNIDFDKEEYKGFYSYIDPKNIKSIYDNKYYLVKYNPDDELMPCRIEQQRKN